MFDLEQSKVTSVLGVDESPLALQRGSKLIRAVQLKCRQQPELKGKVMPRVKLCQVLYTLLGSVQGAVSCVWTVVAKLCYSAVADDLVWRLAFALQGSVTTGDLLEQDGWGSWQGCDAAVACEVVEHVHNPDAFAQSLLGSLRCSISATLDTLSVSGAVEPLLYTFLD